MTLMAGRRSRMDLPRSEAHARRWTLFASRLARKILVFARLAQCWLGGAFGARAPAWASGARIHGTSPCRVAERACGATHCECAARWTVAALTAGACARGVYLRRERGRISDVAGHARRRQGLQHHREEVDVRRGAVAAHVACLRARQYIIPPCRHVEAEW